MYLWIDLWNKKCGIAVYINWIVLPKDIVPRTNIIKVLKKYINEYNVSVLVLWLPYDLYWKDLRQLERTKKFSKKLKEIFPDLDVKLVDERYTSFEADNIIKDGIKWWKDDISAALILESYLAIEKNRI